MIITDFYRDLAKEHKDLILRTKLDILVLGTFQEDQQHIYPTFVLRDYLKEMSPKHNACITRDVPDDIPPSPLKTRNIANKFEHIFVILNKGSTLAETMAILPHHMTKIMIFCLEDDCALTEFDLTDFKQCSIPIHYYKNKSDLLEKITSITYTLQYRKCVAGGLLNQ